MIITAARVTIDRSRLLFFFAHPLLFLSPRGCSEPFQGNTPLHMACKMGDMRTVELLLEVMLPVVYRRFCFRFCFHFWFHFCFRFFLFSLFSDFLFIFLFFFLFFLFFRFPDSPSFPFFPSSSLTEFSFFFPLAPTYLISRPSFMDNYHRKCKVQLAMPPPLPGSWILFAGELSLFSDRGRCLSQLSGVKHKSLVYL